MNDETRKERRRRLNTECKRRSREAEQKQREGEGCGNARRGRPRSRTEDLSPNALRQRSFQERRKNAEAAPEVSDILFAAK